MTDKANIIDHNVLVLDASDSMSPWRAQTIQVVDNHVDHLAERTDSLGFYDSRMTVYTFNTEVQVPYFDQNVLRLRGQSIANKYQPRSMTALVSTVQRAIDETKQTFDKYGDHTYLLWVITDGAENASDWGRVASREQITRLQRTLAELPDTWIVACLVPNHAGVAEAQRFGFPKQNIEIWNPSAQGIIEVGEKIRQATDTYMDARQQGTARSLYSGGQGIFQLDTSKLTTTNVRQNLVAVDSRKFDIFVVQHQDQISSYVANATKQPYVAGSAWYEHIKSEEVRPDVPLMIRERKTGTFYTGQHVQDVRNMVGLPDHKVTVRPNHHPDYDLFFRSTSFNRKLVPGQEIVVFK